jgi:hypothetical protein
MSGDNPRGVSTASDMAVVMVFFFGRVNGK